MSIGQIFKIQSDFYYVTLSPNQGNEYISLEITENKYDVTDRNIEGINKLEKRNKYYFKCSNFFFLHDKIYFIYLEEYPFFY